MPGDDEEQLDSPKDADYGEVAEGSISLPLLPREEFSSPSTSPKLTHPLLVSQNPRFAEDLVERNDVGLQIPRNNQKKRKQFRRGLLFAGLSTTLVVLAWALFLVTAWIKLRPAERGAITGGIGHNF